jgi:murein DD-endopeptidase MepM/ murein hydrolase activator NlpD
MKNNFYITLFGLFILTLFYFTYTLKKSLHEVEENLNNNRIKYHNLIDSLENSFEKKIQNYHNILDSLPLGSPLDTTIVVSNFGPRRSPITGRWQRHAGVDLRGTYWDTVYATGAGKVIMSSWNSGYGKCVEIEHMNGYTSKYAHLSRIWVKTGDMVSVGQPIGKCGKTGMVTGQHLHYEIRRYDKLTDPLDYIFVLSK